MTPHLLRVDDLTKHFRTPAGTVHVLDGVTLEVAAGETLGLVGKSGCGKSTLGKTLVRLYEPDAGYVEPMGVDISHLGPARLRPLRREMRMIFQDPFASLNPRSTVARILEEPGDCSVAEAGDLRRADPDAASRGRPHQVHGRGARRAARPYRA